MAVTDQDILDAMDGIAMILDHELRIIRVGWPNWRQFLDDNPPQTQTGPQPTEDMLGRKITDFIIGETVRSAFASQFQGVLSGMRPFLQIDYRCDAPMLRRDMRLSVRPITTGGALRHLLYQSVVLSVEPRPAIGLFGARVAGQEAEDILTLCAICARVAWPVGAPTRNADWVEPADYYRRGGGEVALISHGFCPDCYARLEQED